MAAAVEQEQHLISSILAMEPSECLISHARACGGGSITEKVQNFIWDHCLSKRADFYAPYLKSFLKKLITEVELDYGSVLDQLYELYAQFMTSSKDGSFSKRDGRICKTISFLFPDGCSELQSCPHSRVLVFPLQCSLNMLEGDTGFLKHADQDSIPGRVYEKCFIGRGCTDIGDLLPQKELVSDYRLEDTFGAHQKQILHIRKRNISRCSIWPSSLFLSELILSHPGLFSNKSCFEIGSGVGLVGLCLAQVKASKVILSDGDLSTLANMKFNLELNHLNVETDMPQGNKDPSMVKCMYLPWESASESHLQDIMPDIVLGADVIYDPVCLPHLVRVLTILLNRKKLHSCRQHTSCNSLSPNSKHENGEHSYRDANDISDGRCKTTYNDGSNGLEKEAPVAYIACVIRNIETFNHFLSLGDQANLDILDLTDSLKPVNLLRYMHSYNQAGVRLLGITCSHKIRLV